MTPEGLFINITNRQKCDKLIKKFSTFLEVYPTKRMPLITELF